MSKGDRILDVRNIHMRFESKGVCVRAVTDVSFPVLEGDHMWLQGGLLRRHDIRPFYLDLLTMISGLPV